MLGMWEQLGQRWQMQGVEYTCKRLDFSSPSARTTWFLSWGFPRVVVVMYIAFSPSLLDLLLFCPCF